MAAEEEMPLAAGTRLGPYEVLALIGAGGMGEVYRARDTRLDRAVAIKVLPWSFSADPERRSRFEREAQTLSGLSHPYICSLYDLGEHNGPSGESTFFLVGLIPCEGACARPAECHDSVQPRRFSCALRASRPSRSHRPSAPARRSRRRDRPGRRRRRHASRTRMDPSRGFSAALRLPTSGTFGNAGVGVVRGPGLGVVDLSINKLFRLGSDRQLQFIVDAFNLFNMPVFNAPDRDLTSATFGQVRSSQYEREIQLGLKFVF